MVERLEDKLRSNLLRVVEHIVPLSPNAENQNLSQLTIIFFCVGFILMTRNRKELAWNSGSNQLLYYFGLNYFANSNG